MNAKNALADAKLPMDQQQGGGSLGGPLRRDRTFFFTNLEGRNLDQTGLVTIPDADRRRDQRAARGGRLSRRAADDRSLSQSGDDSQLPRQDRRQPRIERSVQPALLALQGDGAELARRRRVERAERIGGARQPRSDDRLQQHVDAVAAHRERNARADRARRIWRRRRPTASGRPSASPASPRSARSSASPTARVNTLYQVVDNLSHQAGAHALRAGVDFLYNDDTITFPRSIRGAYTFSSLTELPRRRLQQRNGFTQTFGTTEVSQTNPNVGLYAQDEWKRAPAPHVERGPPLRPAVPRDDPHRYRQPVAARRLCLDAARLARGRRPRRRRAVLRSRAAARAGQRAAVGRQHQRRRQPAPEHRSRSARRRPAHRCSRRSSPRRFRRSRCRT